MASQEETTINQLQGLIDLLLAGAKIEETSHTVEADRFDLSLSVSFDSKITKRARLIRGVRTNQVFDLENDQ